MLNAPVIAPVSRYLEKAGHHADGRPIVIAALAIPMLVGGCEYVRLLRPSIEMYGAPRGTALIVFALP